VFARVALRQRKWDRADSEKHKQIKSASDKMRFDGGASLLFHFGVFLDLEEAEKPHWGESPPSNSDAFGFDMRLFYGTRTHCVKPGVA
jgi:hypothetical protein